MTHDSSTILQSGLTDTHIRGVVLEMSKEKANTLPEVTKGLAAEAECAAARDEPSTVYKITKHLCGNYTNYSGSMKGKDGSTITTEREQADRWVEYCREPHPDR